MQSESQTDWERARREAAEDGPIPFDEQDRLDGLYDPNNDKEVEEFFRTATVTVTRRKPAEPESYAEQERSRLGAREA